MTSRELKVGEEVWAHTGSEACFEKGKVEKLATGKGTIAVRLKQGALEIKEADVHKVNLASQDGQPDNTYLRELNEATLLHNVRTRYNDPKDDGGCYSFVGHILIAVNPFRKLTVYEESNVRAPLLFFILSMPRLRPSRTPQLRAAICMQARRGASAEGTRGCTA